MIIQLSSYDYLWLSQLSLAIPAIPGYPSYPWLSVLQSLNILDYPALVTGYPCNSPWLYLLAVTTISLVILDYPALIPGYPFYNPWLCLLWLPGLTMVPQLFCYSTLTMPGTVPGYYVIIPGILLVYYLAIPPCHIIKTNCQS
ncbi:hypothetical protein CEXT_636261 [Caerostris extrusa]|uniref:Uncharacterized protein n=1 Tax=Caerostris extrusa TaxID=172846 RepID=A0AAV4M332_CAEEX|nr:hypothetical protein CEXT_636261 [Caerostris extrusa]